MVGLLLIQDILNRDTEGSVWHTIQSQVRLVHVNSSQALRVNKPLSLHFFYVSEHGNYSLTYPNCFRPQFSGKQLPDWGFHQHEVTTDRIVAQDDTIWNVEEHRYTKG